MKTGGFLSRRIILASESEAARPLPSSVLCGLTTQEAVVSKLPTKSNGNLQIAVHYSVTVANIERVR
ncbi:MAG: hypothetical protein DME42_01700 [Verrucomicrobia bacterium]|nr:MAG: hypothetical protein DME42_01700 [Verrucomicrobiota bacterium]